MSGGPEYWAENTGINTSKLQSDILLHKHIVFMANATFNRSFLPLICIVIWIYFRYHSPWHIRIWRKQRDLGGSEVGRELDSCHYRCHLINIAVQSIWDWSYSLKYPPIQWRNIGVKYAFYLWCLCALTAGFGKWSGNMSTTWFDFTLTSQHGKWYEKMFLTLDFLISETFQC